MKVANKLKTTMLTAISSSQELVKSIKETPEYAWANNEQNVAVVEDRLATLKGAMTDFQREWMFQPQQTMRKKYTEARLKTELSNFLGHREAVKVLTKLTSTLIARTNVE